MVDPITVNTAFWDLKASELLKFVATVISAIAWPLGTFFIMHLFKGEILKLIPSLSKFSAMGLTAEFNHGLNKAEANVAKISAEAKLEAPPEPTPATPTEPAQEARPTMPVSADLTVSYSIEGAPTPDTATLRANPNGIVMVAWASLESALRALGESAPIRVAVGRKYGSGAIVERLRREGLISAEEDNALQELLLLRNLAAHSSDKISETDALRFKEVADRLTASYRERASTAAKLARTTPPSAENPPE